MSNLDIAALVAELRDCLATIERFRLMDLERGGGSTATEDRIARALPKALTALLDAAEERDRLREQIAAATQCASYETMVAETAVQEIQRLRAQRDALLAALEPIVGQLESAQRSTAPAFLKGFTMNDTESGALLCAIAAAKETP